MKKLDALNKKGEGALGMLTTSAIAVLIAVITVAIAISVNENIKDSFGTNATSSGAAYNATVKGTTGMAAFADYWVSIVSVIILVVIVGLFAYFRGGSGVEVR